MVSYFKQTQDFEIIITKYRILMDVTETCYFQGQKWNGPKSDTFRLFHKGFQMQYLKAVTSHG